MVYTVKRFFGTHFGFEISPIHTCYMCLIQNPGNVEHRKHLFPI